LTVGEEAADRGRHSRLKNFIEQLNNMGSQGYRLIFVTSGWNPNGVVKLDEVQYEYTWFETTSSFFFSKDGFEKKYAELSKQGYRLFEHFFIHGNCEPMDNDLTSGLETCEYKDLFLLERKKGVERPVQYGIAFSGPGWKAKMGEVLTPQINEGIAKGLYPTHAFSKFEILLQQPTDKDEFPIDKPDVRVVTSKNFNWGSNDLEKKVNELGKQGYRLDLINHGIAVMYRHGDMTTPVSYIWLDAKKKDFEKQLKKLQEQSAVYRMTYPDKNGIENKLVFEQRVVDDGKRREYKVLKLDFTETENIAEKKVYVDLTQSSKETMKTLNLFVKEGFVVRDLFVSDKVSVLLERSISK
jgi:hypothetical protein